MRWSGDGRRLQVTGWGAWIRRIGPRGTPLPPFTGMPGPETLDLRGRGGEQQATSRAAAINWLTAAKVITTEPRVLS